ncbi:amyloid fiber anchoring/assembly protein TapA [Rossellomorea vietnamensis]|uniref:amyloid fiber anchoring/assembly protein TapA n=1 Tax=Rossellomorea vietnamensis TaxID=218284 RepID=UPI003CF94D58
MVNIRYVRTKKFRSQSKGLKVVAQLVAIWYIVIFTTSYLTSNTTAYFSDQDPASVTIQAGTWVTESEPEPQIENGISSLDFTSNEDTTVKMCQPGEISTEVINTGDTDMEGTLEYEVHLISEEQGQEKEGELEDSGVIEPLNQNERILLKYQANKAGKYTFKVIHIPDPVNQPEEKQEFWSGGITIQCEEEADEASDQKDEEAPETKQNDEKETETIENDNSTSKEEEEPSIEEEEEVPPSDDSSGQSEPAEPTENGTEEKPSVSTENVPAKDDVDPKPAEPSVEDEPVNKEGEG